MIWINVIWLLLRNFWFIAYGAESSVGILSVEESCSLRSIRFSSTRANIGIVICPSFWFSLKLIRFLAWLLVLVKRVICPLSNIINSHRIRQRDLFIRNVDLPTTTMSTTMCLYVGHDDDDDDEDGHDDGDDDDFYDDVFVRWSWWRWRRRRGRRRVRRRHT